MRRRIAVCTAKLISIIAKKIGKQGVTLAGKIAMLLYPGIMRDLAGDVRRKIIVVCGTNGKTTTNNLLASALKKQGFQVICNETGSNMLNGIASTFVLSAGWNGKLDCDYACLEVDEASAKLIFPHVHPDFMVITNLFRDQLDRYGEIDIAMEELKKAIQGEGENLHLLVNGDDSLSYFIAKDSGKEFRTFGVGEKVENQRTKGEVREGCFCPSCGEKLSYDYYQFSQIGHYHCDSCGFSHPELDYKALEIKVGEHLAFSVENKKYDCQFRGFYNVYNIMAVYGAIKYIGVSIKDFQKVLTEYKPENGRNEEFYIKNCHIVLNLAKNPAGFNQNIYSVLNDKTDKDIIISINDMDQDGRDISWLWDVDFQGLHHSSVKSIILTGLRKEDLKLRFKYEDIPGTVSENIEDAVREKVNHGCGNLYVLVNYTCLYKTHNLLKKMQEEEL